MCRGWPRLREERPELRRRFFVRLLDEVGVEARAGRRVGMPKSAADGPDRHSRRQEAGGREVAKIMEPNGVELHGPPNADEVFGDVVRYLGPRPVRVTGEYVSGHRQHDVARRRPCRAALPVGLQDVHRAHAERYAP